MNKKGKKIMRPDGSELMDYLNKGYAICNNCGAVMDRKEDPAGGCDIYTCPSCGWEVDEMEYEYKDQDEMEWESDVLSALKGDVPPAGCQACGGPYPYCQVSCRMFDD